MVVGVMILFFSLPENIYRHREKKGFPGSAMHGISMIMAAAARIGNGNVMSSYVAAA